MYSALQNEYPNVFFNSKPPKARLPNYLLCPASTSALIPTTECIVHVHPYITQRRMGVEQLHVYVAWALKM